MLSAIGSQGKKICLLNYDFSEIDAFKKLKWFCPACHSPLVLKNGSVKQAHFAHRNLDICDAYSQNESEEHLNLKYQMAKWFQMREESCQVECYLPDLKQTPDLLVNQKLAIEIQCSPLSIERFQERTKNYRSHGYQVIWLLGEKMRFKVKLTRLQGAMCNFSVHSGVFLWQINQDKIELIEMIHVSLTQNISYQKLEFDFFQGHIMNHLRLPYQAHSNSLSFNFNQTRNKQIVCRGLYYANHYWLSLQAFCYQNGLILQNLPNYYYYPGIFPLFYQPLRFRISFISFLKKSRTFSQMTTAFMDQIQTPIQIDQQIFVRALIAFEIQSLICQKKINIIGDSFKMINQINMSASDFEIQSPLRINQWLGKKIRDGEKNEEREIIDS